MNGEIFVDFIERFALLFPTPNVLCFIHGSILSDKIIFVKWSNTVNRRRKVLTLPLINSLNLRRLLIARINIHISLVHLLKPDSIGFQLIFFGFFHNHSPTNRSAFFSGRVNFTTILKCPLQSPLRFVIASPRRNCSFSARDSVKVPIPSAFEPYVIIPV